MVFAIYDLSVGDGLLGIAPMPRENDHLDAIEAWGAAAVISMTTRKELGAAQMPGLGRSLLSRGIEWDHVPVEDYGVPDPTPQANWETAPFVIGKGAVQDLWKVAAKRALRTLADGERVLIHCKGGCGRSGMAALRLMILAGEAPDAALARLRAVRPCAVETDEQLAWATRPLQHP